MAFLRRWAAFEPTDPSLLPPLTDEDFDGPTVQRLARHLTQALGTRLQTWADTLVRAVSAEPDEFSVGRELAQARHGLVAIREMAGHRGLPPALRERLTRLVDERVHQLQEQLEEQLETARREDPLAEWIEERRRTLRDNPLTAVSTRPPSTEPPGDPWAYDPTTVPRRKVGRD
ncbi:hypothetical protein ACIBG6_16520 [Streptomyces sp. NPDC050842]|uniref:hypothetical protein n=1 Tax=Streptomyces sp. NPDC050842 TaxID=3365636 RepID=UPI0037A6A2F5